jgi:hypothetical protein
MASLDPEATLERLIATRQQVAQMCGDPAPQPVPGQIGERYQRAPSLAQRRFDRLAGETTRIAAAGLSALMTRDQTARPPAARLLAQTLDREIGQLLRLVR